MTLRNDKGGFVDWKPLTGVYASNWALNEDGMSVKWTDIKIWQVCRNSPDKFFCQKHYSEEPFNVINVCHKDVSERSVKVTSNRQISTQTSSSMDHANFHTQVQRLARVV